MLQLIVEADRARLLERTNSYKIIGNAELVQGTAQPDERFQEKLFFIFKRIVLFIKIRYGDRLIVKTTLNKTNPPMNPGEFNYKRYLSNKGIYCQGYVRTGEWQISRIRKKVIRYGHWLTG